MHDILFEKQLDLLKKEGNYRIFADLKRSKGQFPRARNYGSEALEDVTVWCSNDYLGMGQNSKVLEAMHNALNECGAGSGSAMRIRDLAMSIWSNTLAKPLLIGEKGTREKDTQPTTRFSSPEELHCPL